MVDGITTTIIIIIIAHQDKNNKNELNYEITTAAAEAHVNNMPGNWYVGTLAFICVNIHTHTNMGDNTTLIVVVGSCLFRLKERMMDAPANVYEIFMNMWWESCCARVHFPTTSIPPTDLLPFLLLAAHCPNYTSSIYKFRTRRQRLT